MSWWQLRDKTLLKQSPEENKITELEVSNHIKHLHELIKNMLCIYMHEMNCISTTIIKHQHYNCFIQDRLQKKYKLH